MTNVVTTPTTATGTTTVPTVPFFTNPTLGLFGVSYSPTKATVVGADVLMYIAQSAMHGQYVNPLDLYGIGIAGINSIQERQYISTEGTAEFNLHVEFSGLKIGMQASVNIHHSQTVTNFGNLDSWWVDTFFTTGPNEYASVNWYTQGSDSSLGFSRTEKIGHTWQNGNTHYSDMVENNTLVYRNIEMRDPLLTLIGQAEELPWIPSFH